jgi:hypothetical protein
MGDNYEHLIFISEYGRLLEEYKSCLDLGIKQEIYKDITLIGKVISL